MHLFFSSWCALNSEHAASCGSPHHTTSTSPRFIFVCVTHHAVCFCFVFYLCMHSSPPFMFLCMCVVSYRKTITVKILDRKEYNKQSFFYVVLEPPLWIRNKKENTGVMSSLLWECFLSWIIRAFSELNNHNASNCLICTNNSDSFSQRIFCIRHIIELNTAQQIDCFFMALKCL